MLLHLRHGDNAGALSTAGTAGMAGMAGTAGLRASWAGNLLLRLCRNFPACRGRIFPPCHMPLCATRLQPNACRICSTGAGQA